MAEKSNGVYVEMAGDGEDKQKGSYLNDHRSSRVGKEEGEGITLFTILNRLVTAILFPNSSASLFHRVKVALSQNIPLLRVASKNTAHKVLLWTRCGSPLRALLVVSVGTIALLALSGLLVFMFFFVAATVNAIVISLLVSLAAAGGCLAIFFALLTAIYISALSVAVFVISATTISAIIAALIATGWIGFFLTIWLATRKGFGLAKRSLSMTGSAVSAYSSGRFARRHQEPKQEADQ